MYLDIKLNQLEAIAKEIFLKNHEMDETNRYILDEEEILEIIFKHLGLPKKVTVGKLPNGLLQRVREKQRGEKPEQ